MVNTRSQVNRESRSEQAEVDRFAGDDANSSVADHYSRSYTHENDGKTMRSLEREHERLRIEQRFLEKKTNKLENYPVW